MKRFGLIGFPLSHSFSKKYFSEKFDKEGLNDHVYDLFPITSIDQLPELVHSKPDLVGLNVTIPYKRAVIPFLQGSFLPSGLDAVNCIRLHQGKMTGYNTDVIGFENSFVPLLLPSDKKALVLGNGGATAAVVHVLKKLGIEYHIVSRALHPGSTLVYTDLNEDVIEEHSVIINTTPLGTFPDIAQTAPIPYEFITAAHYLFDLIYNPEKTTFLSRGEAKGARIKNGHEMLIIQAEESWKIWNS